MRKSSRFWLLHGAILLSAVVGCKSCNNGGGNCSPGMSGGAPPYGGTASSSGPVGGAGATMYSQSAPYTGGAAMPGSGSSFAPGGTAGYPMPNMASSIPQGMGSTR